MIYPFIRRGMSPGAYAEYILKDKYNDFLIWAFGSEAEDLPINELSKRWNERHSDKMKLEGDMNIIESTEKMIELFKEVEDKSLN